MSLTVTDLFCGAGGSSLGAEMAGGELRLGLNHWERAIETHATNFGHADHDCTDISACDPRRYPATDILLASPECTNHSLAKGALRRKPQVASLWEDGPAGDAEQDRSRATMWDVVRFAEAMIARGRPYKAIVVENVVDAFKWGPDDNGCLFDAWLLAMRALGYEHEIVWLNSMFAGWVPQSRNRMYVVFWLKTIRRPNLRFEPIAWCPNCERVVRGRQTWKKAGLRVWGSYGAQYFYTCPDCGHAAIPGAPPAMYAIDRDVPITRIAEQKPKKCKQCGRRHPVACSTRRRIRVGLRRLAGEPFAIRLTHAGAPRTLTLPLVTLTCRHDMAMVMPIAGNTHERTPGSRSDDATTAPLRAVHGTLDRAIVVPPMGAVAGRDATTDTVPTQTTTTRPALVMANTENGVPRPARNEPAQTLRTEGGLGMVVANDTRVGCGALEWDALSADAVVVAHYDPGWARPAAEQPMGGVTCKDSHSLVLPMATRNVPSVAEREPTATITAGGNKVALVVPYNRTGAPTRADTEPCTTLTTRDRQALVLTEADVEDCGFRMFELHEIAAAMAMQHRGDGSDYVVLGNKRERMAQYGNAVTPPAMRLLVSRLLDALDG